MPFGAEKGSPGIHHRPPRRRAVFALTFYFLLFTFYFASDRFHHRRDALTASDARGGDAAPGAATAKLQRERKQKPRPAHAERMSERNRSAVDVHLLPIEA